ncbi:MAG TPA: hypothetical protein VN922_12455 [Bacteroidia bacterium]|nr:hypothetical protein [Bacteroidia bacterium]
MIFTSVTDVYLFSCRSPTVFGKRNDPLRIDLPKEGENILQFKNYKHKEYIPLVFYFDFESLLLKWGESHENSVRIQKHEPMALGYIRIIHDDYKEKKEITSNNITSACLIQYNSTL